MNYTIKEGFDNMNFTAVTDLLANAHWSRGISQAEVEKAAANSALVVGVFDEADHQIGFARVVSDKTRFAYLMDVIISEACRDTGIGEAMVSYILKHPELADVYQWMLITTHAHDFYEKCGFVRTTKADDLMEIRKPRPR